MLDHDEVVRLYGPWRHRTPDDAVELFNGYSGLWWIAGGWAIEAFTGIPRPHGDLDPSIPRSDVVLLRQHLISRLDVWAADKGALRPLVGEVDEPLPSTCADLWVRASGADPREYDIILMDATISTWTYKRDPRVSRDETREVKWATGVQQSSPDTRQPARQADRSVAGTKICRVPLMTAAPSPMYWGTTWAPFLAPGMRFVSRRTHGSFDLPTTRCQIEISDFSRWASGKSNLSLS
jgi:hypothetical protein